MKPSSRDPTHRQPDAAHQEPASALESHLGYWLRFVSNHVSQAFQRKVEDAGVTVSEWVIMRELHSLGATSPTGLGRKIGMTKGAISKLIARLRRKGLLSRSIIETDRRNHLIELTPDGHALVPALARLADSNDEAFFGHLSTQARADLIEAMVEIVRIHRLKTVPIK